MAWNWPENAYVIQAVVGALESFVYNNETATDCPLGTYNNYLSNPDGNVYCYPVSSSSESSSSSSGVAGIPYMEIEGLADPFKVS